MKKISDLFDVKYGVNLELNSLIMCKKNDKNAINFVSRTSKNNGVSAIVEKVAGVEPIPAGTLSVACGGSVLETFLQPEEYYSGRDLFYLTPRENMTDFQKIYYCTYIRANKYRYNYGRQANKTLKDILIPDIEEIPIETTICETIDYSQLVLPYNRKNFELDTSKWKWFVYNDIFKIRRGESYYLQDIGIGKYPYVSASSNNNGISAYVNVFNRKENLIVLNYDGSIGEAFYQPTKFFASEKVVTIDLKEHKLNKYIAMFLITLFRKEKFRYNYGLKWSVNKKMKESVIKLPVDKNDTPDWEFIEDYIKSLPYSKNL